MKTRGFTLIEILVALGIFVLVITITGVFFRNALFSYQENQVLAQRYQSLKRIFWLMSEELSSALGGDQVSTDEIKIFKADRYSLFFIYPSKFELQEIGYIFQEDRKVLLRRESRCDFNFDTFDREEVVGSNIEELNFSFFDGRDWKDTSLTLPRAVKISISLNYKNYRENYEELINIPAGK